MARNAAKPSWPADKVERRPVADLIPYARNARTHSDRQIEQIAASIREWGWTVPVLIDEDGGIIAGHGRILAAKLAGIEDVPCMVATGWSKAQKQAYVLADNKLAENAAWDYELLKDELQALGDEAYGLDLTGFGSDELDAIFSSADGPVMGESPRATSLAERFGIPPFSVLNAREGWWQERKRAWLSLGIQSEVGRGDNTLGFNDAAKRTMTGAANPAVRTKFGKCLETGIGEKYGREEMNSTSIFDPVLSELAYRWFCPPGGVVIDPFAGGSVRGIVASELGRRYVGCELRSEQVEANIAQSLQICRESAPVWHVGDSRNIAEHCAGTEADFVFSCPPYADLEVYSDDPRDISTLAYKEFRAAYFEIIAATCAMLKPDRFAVFVVGEVRDKRGNYYGFVPDTIEAFRRVGLQFYNEAILVTAVGSLPIRAGKQFETGRKLGKTHQNVLVFVKGNPKRATEAVGDVEFEPLSKINEAA